MLVYTDSYYIIIPKRAKVKQEKVSRFTGFHSNVEKIFVVFASSVAMEGAKESQCSTEHLLGKPSRFHHNFHDCLHCFFHMITKITSMVLW